ncbi:MAG TPA: ABC transporter ATP-binding protein/permease [Candidatus Eubacterium faecavium]|nr:ABC transporter ATP-binding protein/permease [Candidatus Eubacterium faecavium]
MKKQSNLKRLMDYAGGHRYLTYASWVLSALSAFIALVPFIYIWRIIEEVLEAAPDFSAAQNLTRNGWMAVLFAVISVLVYIGALMCSHISAFRVATNIRIQAMRHIVELPLGFAESFGSGRLRKIVNESSAATETYLAHQLPDKAGAVATPIGLLVLLLAFDWRLGLLSLVPVVLAFIIMMSMTGREMARKMKEYQNALDDMSNEAVEYVRGIPVVKTFGQTVYSFKKFKDSIDRYGVWVIAYTKQLRTPMIFYTAAVNGVFVFLTAAALFFTRNGVTNEFLIDLIFYIMITPIISVTLTKIMFQSENEMIVNDALQRIDSVLDMKPLEETKKPALARDGSVELKNVTFSYDGETDVIKNLSLRAAAGSTVALVGPSGGGKTTLANLIARFFDPKSGSVLIGGENAKNIPKNELMNTVSFVFQNSRLIKASVLDNVRLGRPGADEEDVMRALQAAQCSDILEKLPRGIHTVIGEKGVYLSGGEQQRIAIARAILKDSPIIILDEATAFADPDNETKVQAAFTNLSKGKTVIMIAHRLSTVVHADCIYVIKNGEIVQSGTFDKLREEPGVFAQMWNDYQTSVKWKVARRVEND